MGTLSGAETISQSWCQSPSISFSPSFLGPKSCVITTHFSGSTTRFRLRPQANRRPEGRRYFSRPKKRREAFVDARKLLMSMTFARRRFFRLDNTSNPGPNSLDHAAGAQDHRPRTLVFLDLRLQHDRRRSGNSAILAHAPEVHAHEDRSDQRYGDAMPDVGAQQRIGVHD